MKHNRDYCLDCGRKLNRHEWYYGACSECIKKRAKANKWRPTGHDGRDIQGWFYALNAPRMSEYMDYHDLNDEGVVALMETLFRGGGHYARRNPVQPEEQLPPGTKRCRKCHRLIPAEGYATCDVCLKKHQAYINERRWRWQAAGCCSACGEKLPEGYKNKTCTDCLNRFKQYTVKARAKAEGIVI